MKIYVLPISKRFQPDSQPFVYPAHNRDYGVEQDFSLYLSQNPHLLTSDRNKADWHFLPIYWTRWHLNHDYGQKGLDLLSREVERVMVNDAKTFTVCQYDDGPLADLGKVKLFLSSRKTKAGLDIPLLSTPLKLPLLKPGKKYLAGFVGRLSTHPMRQKMAQALSARTDISIIDGDLGVAGYTKQMLQSHVALCPRGYGGSSFRFYEAMQLGVLPFLIGEIDTRPFKAVIDWDECSLYTASSDSVQKILNSFPIEKIRQMSIRAKKIYKEHLAYGAWCKYVLQALE